MSVRIQRVNIASNLKLVDESIKETSIKFLTTLVSAL